MGMLDDPEVQAPATPVPGSPAAPGGWWEKAPLVAGSNQAPRAAVGVMENIQAGLEASVPALAWRQKLPSLVMDPEHSKWWERLAGVIAQVVPDLSVMIPGGVAGAVAGTAVGGPVGGILGAGAGSFGPVDGLRTALMESYRAREAQTPIDFWNILRETAIATAKGAAVGAVTFGGGAVARAGAAAALGVGGDIAGKVGLGTASVASRVGNLTTGTADVAAQIVGMTIMPRVFEDGPFRWPEAREFVDGTAIILALKGGHYGVDKALDARTQRRMEDTYIKTGKTPADLVAAAHTDPKIAEDLTGPPTPLHGTIGIGKLVAEAEFLARGGIPEAPNIKTIIAELKAEGPLQKDLLADVDRIGKLADEAKGKPLGDPEREELETLRKRVAEFPQRHEESAQKVYDDVLQQIRDVDQARKDAGLPVIYGPGEAEKVAAVKTAQTRTFASIAGVFPEEIYRARGDLRIRDETAAEVAAAEAAIPVDAPRFEVPEVDMFGEPVVAPMVPRHAVEGLPMVDLAVAQLKLSKDVPQFKKDANDEGVVHKLGGKPDPTGWAVQVWERLNGDLEVISGRHRLDLWRRENIETIPSQIHREADGFTKEMAMVLDAELNIRDEQGSIADYVQYFKAFGLSKEAADARGLLDRAKGRSGFAIARDASPDLLAAHRAGVVSDEAALAISVAAPGSESLQNLGMRFVLDGKSSLMAVNMMKAAQVYAADKKAAGAQGDIFGGIDDTAIVEMARMAKLAGSKQREISQQINAAYGASKNPRVAREMGIDVNDPEGTLKKIAALRQEQTLWDNWPLHPELVARLRGSEVTGREGDLAPQSPPSKYTPEIQARLDEAKAEHEKTVEFYKRRNQPDTLEADLKGAGMRYAAEKRQITGELTATEQAAKDKREAGNYIGKEVSVEGFDAVVTANPFGRVTVEFADGTKKTIEADQIQPRTLKQDPVEDFVLKPETPAELAARNREAVEQAIRKLAEESVTAKRGRELTAEERKAQFDLFSQKNTLFQRRQPSEKELRERGEPVSSLMDAMRRQADGERIFAGHEMDESHPIELGIRDLMASTYTYDQMIALPPATRYEVYNTRTGEVIGNYENSKRARRVADKKDLEYGAVSYSTRPLNVLRQQERGSYQISQGELASYDRVKRVITTFETANKSSILHELGHDFLEDLKFYAEKPDAPERFKQMWETAQKEFAISGTGQIGTASHEQLARSWERYLGTGEAPTAALRSIFEQFKKWMLDIYQSLVNIPTSKINPEIKLLFDQMLATDQEIADARELNVPRAYVAEAKASEAAKIVTPAREIKPGFEAEQASMEPYADELPKGPGEAPDNSHINYAYINAPMDVKLAIQKMAEIDQANIQKQRGGKEGVKSWAESNAEQAKYVNDILGGSEDTLRLLSPRDPEAPGPDVRLGILKKLAVGAAKDSARLRDVVLSAGHDATVRQQLEYMGSIERARMIQAEFLGERAGVARALNALKDVTEGSGEIGRMLDAIGYGEEAANTLHQDPRTPAEENAVLKAKLDEILLKYKGRSVLDIAQLHKEIGTLKGSYEFTRKLEKATTWEQVIEGWRSGLLSGPVTHTTNLFGTGAFQVLRTPVDALAAVIGMARGASPGMGESDRASMSEAISGLTAYLGATLDGLKVGKATFDLDDPTGKTEAYRTAIPGRAGELIRIPLRMMGAEDAMVTTMYKRKLLTQLAMRTAFDEELNPGSREFAERVDALKDKPTPEMQVAIDSEATRMTFNSPLGEKGIALQNFVNKWNLQWMLLFIRTPINITKELGRMSPFAPLVGEWRTDIRQGGVARDKALAEFALGSGIMALTMAYTFSGQISGSGSPDPGKNRAKAGVWQPGSIRIGDTWYEYTRIQPMGTLMQLAADLAETWDHTTDEEKDKVPKMLARAFANAVTNQTFLQGITNVINAMSDPTRFAPSFFKQMAASAVPNIIGQPTTMADPTVREVNGMLEAIQARIPGLRQDLLPKRDWLGEEVKTKERLAVVGPVREQPISDDKVRTEAARLEISIADAPKKTHLGKGTGKIGDVEFTPEERSKFAQVGGEMAHKILAGIVNQPGWDTTPEMLQRKIFAKVLSASHRVAAFAALPPDKRASYLQEITEKVAAELAPAEQ